MTGETDSGITFGATIRADNAAGGQGGTNGQTAGSVFVSGSWGTLTMGDTNGADEQWVGDVPGDYSLTGLGDLDETPFISNGGGFGSDNGDQLRRQPVRPPDHPLRLRHHGLRHLAVVQPRPDRHRRRHRLLGGLRRRQLVRSAPATTTSPASTHRSERCAELVVVDTDRPATCAVTLACRMPAHAFPAASSGRSA